MSMKVFNRQAEKFNRVQLNKVDDRIHAYNNAKRNMKQIELTK